LIGARKDQEWRVRELDHCGETEKESEGIYEH
jgi:hypothetical protein